MLRILYFSPRDCWPLNTGARLRDYHLAHQLSRHAEVSYAALAEPGSPPLAELPPDAGFRQTAYGRDRGYSIGKLIGGLTGPVPVTVRNYTSATAKASLRAMLRESKYDAVQIEGVHLAGYVRTIRETSPGTKIVADWHNIESELMTRYAEGCGNVFKRLYARRTASLIARSENRLLAACDAHCVVSVREREKLLARLPGTRVEVVPNGVDLDYYSSVRRVARDVIFVGSMDYHANIDAAEWLIGEIWPHLRGARMLRIVGRKPPESIEAMATTDIDVTGTVDDVRDYYAEALVLVVPLRVGGGTRLKILEAMAAGVPVVSTRLGAEGIDATDGVDILLADTAEDIAGQVERLTADAALAHRLAENGRALAKRSYGWEAIGRSLFEVHESLVGR